MRIKRIHLFFHNRTVETRFKVSLLVPLKKIITSQTESPEIEALILDGAVIVNMLKSRFCKTLEDYAKNVFLPYIDNQLMTCSRFDVVWDEYRQGSLKASTLTSVEKE
ncbi:hypothetical protein DPMN_083379 [Dreissena polymorpha]|uniref:Uncharacterized protein n=1 Tax=Dreissena polymorpha TaxID=45954 RepID=A0A9D4BHN0_DREPO|nr:hypothetical protein DPMN_083379 [Dreissena polymorpha]